MTISISKMPAPLVALAFSSLLSSAIAQDLSGGLQVEVTKPVKCTRKTHNGDTLQVNYRGTLQSDGSEFDSSYGKSPFSFKLGQGMVIKGWDHGLLDMCIGEGRKLIIPPSLAYGDASLGKIPPNSVLVFETELLGIQGVIPEPTAPEEVTTTSAAAVSIQTAPPQTNAKEPSKGSEKGPAHDGDNSECKLLGKFALLIQAALGALALLSLVWKRWRERPRRPVKIWFFDVSKQVVGSLLLHFANLFMAMLSSGEFQLQNTAGAVMEAIVDGETKKPNPCSFYLLNLAIDTTIGIPILVFLLRILHALFVYTPLANPPESLKSGNYGHPPQTSWWLKQALIYFIGLFGMKLCVFVIFQLFPWIGWVGDWALRWTEGKAWMQIVFVMLIFPTVMNAAQYWIIDSFIKDPSGDYEYENPDAARRRAEEEEEEYEGLMGRRRDSEDEEQVSGDGVARTKEANPLPVPVELESDDEDPSKGSPGSSTRK